MSVAERASSESVPADPRGAAVFLHPDAGTSTSPGDHHRSSSSTLRRVLHSKTPLRSAPLRSAPQRDGGHALRGQYNCRRVQSVEILLSRGRCAARPRHRRDALLGVATRETYGAVASPGRGARGIPASWVAPRVGGTRGRSTRVVNWSPADCTAPPSVQSAAIDASDRCVARNSKFQCFNPPRLDQE